MTVLLTNAAGIDNLTQYVVIGAIVLIVFLLLIRNIRIVPQATTFVIERLGAYQATWTTGIHMKLPFIDRISKVISMKERVADFPPQAVITADNVTMEIDTVLFYQILDPKLYTYGIENPILAIENLTTTTLRNIIGDLELDQTLTSRDVINTKMREILDVATDPWGIKVNRVELKNIIPPREIQNAMERQMKAERDKREQILVAEGKKEAAIRVAEGEKMATVLRAEATKERAIREAEGQAEAILTVQDATARGLNMIKSVGADAPLITLRSLEAMEKVANGRATKIIIPSELQNLAGLATTLKELFIDPADDGPAPQGDDAETENP
ncbi:MAG TPA: SPFH/Band 7/PHB domain protein [Clostridiaceae bacterium]|jgi:regulator of protease activity HflC (stomatin/prohibitin superfamily)|nr:SPFH/Band 7/PHB domain protein [Clostridiaceae bacterium]